MWVTVRKDVPADPRMDPRVTIPDHTHGKLTSLPPHTPRGLLRRPAAPARGGFVSSQPPKKGFDKLQDMSLSGITHLIPKNWSRNHPVMSMSATQLMSA
jgi:hypothetical protein